MGIIDIVHGRMIHGRRVRVLAAWLARCLPENAHVLDVGCGDGRLDRLLMESRPDLRIEGLDVLVRPDAQIPVKPFDGAVIPLPADAVDVVMFIDVLHHTPNPGALIREASRVAKHSLLIKDHHVEGFLARPTLCLMDWVGNARHGVVLPYNFLRRDQWLDAFKNAQLDISEQHTRLGLYPWPLSLVFERHLHMLTMLERNSDCTARI